MIATKDSFETTRVAQPRKHSGWSDDATRVAGSAPPGSDQLPNSKKIYVEGQIHPYIRVPMREIELTPTKSLNGQIEVNEPVRVYDCSGPWGDPKFTGTVEAGLPALRANWIRNRGDVEEYDGRRGQPIDDGYFSEKHRGLDRAKRQDETSFRLEGLTAPRCKPLRAKPGK